jgi:hypothetical protein
VSVEKVVATIETPKSHQGIFPPAAKNSEALLFFLEVQKPIPKEINKNPIRITQSMVFSIIVWN